MLGSSVDSLRTDGAKALVKYSIDDRFTIQNLVSFVDKT